VLIHPVREHELLEILELPDRQVQQEILELPEILVMLAEHQAH